MLRRAGPPLMAVLLLLTVASLGLTEAKTRGPASSIGSAVGRYSAAIAARDVPGAMAEMSPASRDHWLPFVSNQVGNVYAVQAVSVRWPSLLEQLGSHATGQAYEAVIVMDVDKDRPADYYQASTWVGVTQEDGRWYLSDPPLGREAEAEEAPE